MASYTTGNAQGLNTGTGNLIGSNNGGTFTPNRSFGFGTATNSSGVAVGNSLVTPLPYATGTTTPISMPNQLTLALANTNRSGDTVNVWNNSAHNTLNAWDFTNRARSGGPSLMYNDYDGTGNRFYCDGTPEPTYNSATEPRPIRITSCGTHLPHQFAE